MKSKRGGQRKGSGRPRFSAEEKKIQWWIYLKQGDIAAFEAIGGTKEQVANWIRLYPMARGETDRLLAQSPVAGRLLSYLEAIGTPEAEVLAEELFSLIADRTSDEVRIDGGVIQAGDSWIA